MKMRKDKSKIKIVIMNPECIKVAQEKMFKFVYENYIRGSIENDTL